MILIGLVAGLITALISPIDFEWGAFATAFLCVFLVGIISLVSPGLMKRQTTNDIVRIMFGTLFRATLSGMAIVIVVITQPKTFAFYMLCFSVIFYLGMVFLNTWLMLPVQHNRQEPDSNRGKSNGNP